MGSSLLTRYLLGDQPAHQQFITTGWPQESRIFFNWLIMTPEANVRSLMSVEKLERILAHFDKILQMLQRSPSLALHRDIDQSFYMQKIAEFVLLKEQLQTAIRSLDDVQSRACMHYEQAFPVWREDLRIIRFLLNTESSQDNVNP